MFSSMTMASSTTKPTEMVSAISDRLSRLKPTRYITAAVPSSASGTVTPGISVAGTLRKKTKITITTSAMVSSRVNSTSSTEALMFCVRSTSTLTCTAGGSAASNTGSAARMRATVSTTLAPGTLNTPSTMARPLIGALSVRLAPAPENAHAACLTSSGPVTARPTSRTRIGAPFL